MNMTPNPRPLSRFALALAFTALSCGLCRAQPVAPKNPCSNVANLQTRADILAAVPESDSDWRQILSKRGIHKTENGEWMQYYLNGEIFATYKAFAAALGDYCAARVPAAPGGVKPETKAVLAPAMTPAEVAEERRRQADYKEKLRRAEARSIWTTSSSGEALAGAPAVPQSAPSACPPSLCETANSCAEAGVGDNNLGSDFRCRKAIKEASSCTCQ
jgi:hypothetical protein